MRGTRAWLCRPPPASAKPVARSRAQISATNVLVEAVSWITPLQPADSPTIWRSQSVATSSISVTAGLDCQDRPSTPRPVLTRSPRMPAFSALAGK